MDDYFLMVVGMSNKQNQHEVTDTMWEIHDVLLEEEDLTNHPIAYKKLYIAKEL